MNLTAANTAIVLDSTADFPEAPARYPNMRVVPLYVRFGEESFRDYVELGPDAFYDRLRTRRRCRPPRSRRRRTSSRSTRSSAAYERILSLHIASNLSGTYASAGLAAQELGGDRVRLLDSRTASAAIAMLALAIQRRLERGTTDEEVEALVEPLPAERGAAVHRRHARVPREGRAHRPGSCARRAAPQRQADPHDRGRRGRAAHASARLEEGDGRVLVAVRRRRRPTRLRCGSASRTRRRPSAWPSSRRSCATCARRR